MQVSFLRRNIFLCLLAILTCAGVTPAQTGTTSLHGVITDKTGAVLAGASLTLVNSEKGLERTITSGTVGEYEFLSLPPGTYKLTVELANFRKFEQTGLQLLVNVPTTVNVTLEVGSSTQTVEVSAQAATLNTTDA